MTNEQGQEIWVCVSVSDNGEEEMAAFSSEEAAQAWAADKDEGDDWSTAIWCCNLDSRLPATENSLTADTSQPMGGSEA